MEGGYSVWGGEGMGTVSAEGVWELCVVHGWTGTVHDGWFFKVC